MKRIILYVFACLCLFCSCERKETITDVYYVYNSSSQPVSLVFDVSMWWDTCSVKSTADYTLVEKNSKVEIPSGKTIRLHPILRTYDNPKTHQLDVTLFIGQAKLVCGTDTIVWKPAIKERPPRQDYCMFTDDAIWSIFNTTCWSSEQDTNLPYTYYHTFSITDSNLERDEAL